MYASVDIGGTNTRIASFVSLEKPEIIENISWLDSHIKKEDSLHLKLQLRSLGHHFKALGIGITGDLNKDKIQVNETRWNHEWEKIPIVEQLSNEFDCPVFMENDAVVAALGVAYFEEGKNEEFIYITWGTGIGGAKITLKDGKPNAHKLDWFRYFEKWEAKCGGKRIELNYKKSPKDLKKYEWDKILEIFNLELDLFRREFEIKNVILGGGITMLKKDYFLNYPSINVTSLGNDVGLYGGIGLIKSKLYA